MTDDTIMDRVAQAVEQGRAGQRAAARDALESLWAQTTDPFHLCTIAHYVADLQDTAEDELKWDERALATVAELTDARVQEHDASFRVRAFLPSLHLNLAEDHRKLGDPGRAREHLAAAEETVGLLPDDEYGTMIRGGIEGVRRALAAG